MAPPGSDKTGPLVRDVTPAEKNIPRSVGMYELENLPEGRAVYMQRGSLLFLSSKREAFAKLSQTVSTSLSPPAPTSQPLSASQGMKPCRANLAAKDCTKSIAV